MTPSATNHSPELWINAQLWITRRQHGFGSNHRRPCRPGRMEDVSTWPAPCTSRPVNATVTVPGSKSQTNRALVLSALAATHGGVSTITGALRSRDTDLMIGALEALGLKVDGPADDLTVGGSISPAAQARIDCGLAGTVLRFVPPLAALSLATVTFDGDEQARGRPLAPPLHG